MTEIKIEKKKSVWPWVLMILLSLVPIWFFFLRDSDDNVEVEETTTEEVVKGDETGMGNQTMNSTDAIAKYSFSTIVGISSVLFKFILLAYLNSFWPQIRQNMKNNKISYISYLFNQAKII
jgi:hypothetical protein